MRGTGSCVHCVRVCAAVHGGVPVHCGSSEHGRLFCGRLLPRQPAGTAHVHQEKKKRQPSIVCDTTALLLCAQRPVPTKAPLVWIQELLTKTSVVINSWRPVLRTPKAVDLHTAILHSVLCIDSSACLLQQGGQKHQAAFDHLQTITCKL